MTDIFDPASYIVEGADCVGKTYFAHKFIDYLNKSSDWFYSYSHIGPVNDYVRKNRDVYFALYTPSMAVQDRSMLSEYVYGNIQGLKDIPTLEELRDFHFAPYGFLPNLNWTIVFIADEELIRKRYDVSRELFSLENVLEANRLFEQTIDEMIGDEDPIKVPCIKLHVGPGLEADSQSYSFASITGNYATTNVDYACEALFKELDARASHLSQDPLYHMCSKLDIDVDDTYEDQEEA